MHPVRSTASDPTALAPPPPRERRSIAATTLDRFRVMLSWHAPLTWFAVAMAAIAVVSAAGLVLDDRILVGAPIWAKALKFALSFGIYALTLGWMIQQIRGRRVRRIAWWAGSVLGAAALWEMVIIVGQIIRGTLSHFNQATPFDNTVFSLMGSLISTIFAATLVIAIIMAFTPMSDVVLRWSVRLGALISILGLSTGFLMLIPTPEQAALGDASPTQGAHGVGVADGGPSIPILGWSTTGGDLRISHFVGMHALQLLPLLAVVLTHFFGRRLSVRTRLQIVVLSAVGYSAVFALVLWQALRGQSIVSPDALTIAGAIVILLGTGAGAVLIRSRARAHRSSTPATPTLAKDPS